MKVMAWFLVAAAALGARPPEAELATRPDDPQVVFLDDFGGAALDRSKWNVEVSGPIYNDERQAYIDSGETLRIVRGDEAKGAEGGALEIAARHRPGFQTPDGRSFDFVSARITTRDKFEFTSGTASARMKLPAGSGFWPAFWALGGGNWPETGEIDIMEYVGEPDWTSVALHGPGYSGETPLVNKQFFPPGEDVTGWHVYEVRWDQTGFRFHVDGRLIYRATRPMVEHYGRWVYDTPEFLILNLAIGGIYPLKTNGVRTPQTGLPAETIAKIDAGEGVVLVDWVKVTTP